jgi:hypothetical protein
MKYDESQDQSERFGWKKWCEEERPTEEEQNRWGYIGVLSTAVITTAVLVLDTFI